MQPKALGEIVALRGTIIEYTQFLQTRQMHSVIKTRTALCSGILPYVCLQAWGYFTYAEGMSGLPAEFL